MQCNVGKNSRLSKPSWRIVSNIKKNVSAASMIQQTSNSHAGSFTDYFAEFGGQQKRINCLLVNVRPTFKVPKRDDSVKSEVR